MGKESSVVVPEEQPFDSQKESYNEDEFASKPIPKGLRKHWFGVAAIYFGMVVAMSSFVSGGSLITGLTLGQSIIAILFATLVLIFLFFVPIGYIGVREGLNTYLIGESAFGTKGTNIATGLVITIIPCMGWYGVQVSIAADALTIGFGGNESLTPLFMILLGILFAVPAMYGITSMAWLDYISIPIILFITFFGVYSALNLSSLDGLFSYTPETSQSIFWGANLLIGSMVVGASFVADYTRWSHNKLSSVTNSGIAGIFPPLFVLTIIGSVMALSATNLGVDEPWNIAQVLHALGMPIVALLLIVVLQWTTNITSAYSGGLALHKLFGWSRFWWTLVIAIVGTLLSLGGIIDHFLGFLGFLAILVSPAAGVIISEYYFVSNRELKQKSGFYWPGIVSWLIGGLAAYVIPFFIDAINGLIVAALVYYLIHKFIGTQNS